MRLPLNFHPSECNNFFAPDKAQVYDRTQIRNPKVGHQVFSQSIGFLAITLFVLLESLNVKPYVTASNLHNTNYKSYDQTTIFSK